MLRSLLCLSILMFALPSFAAVVAKVKGKSALIDLKGDSASSGDNFYSVNADGKRVGLIRIAKVKGEKAIGKILKGKVSPGQQLELQQAKVAGSSGGGGSKRGKSASSTSTMNGTQYWGGQVGFTSDKMDVNVNDSVTGLFREKASLSGTGFSAKGLFDYKLFPFIWFRGLAGIENFSVTGPSKCGSGNTQPCTAKIMYLDVDLLARAVYDSISIRPWFGLGVDLLFPMSKTATALQANSISTTNVFVVAGGVDWFVSPDLFIPVTLEYGMLPKSDEVSASYIALRVGVAVPF